MVSAFAAYAQETRALTELPEGGFAPQGAGFRVTFRLANMKRVAPNATGTPLGSRQDGMEWSDGQGARARLEICCVKHPFGLASEAGTLAAARLLVANPAGRPWATSLSVEIAPEGAIYALAIDRHAFFIEGRPVLVADSPSRGAILADAPFAVRPLAPQQRAHVESAKGECRGEMIFDLALPPGQTLTLGFLSPVHLPKGEGPDLDSCRAISVEDLFAQAEKEAARK